MKDAQLCENKTLANDDITLLFTALGKSYSSHKLLTWQKSLLMQHSAVCNMSDYI